MKVRIKDRLQDVQQCLLDDSVANCWDAKMPLAASRFRYRNSADSTGPVSLGPQFVHQPRQLPQQVSFKIGYRLSVSARCTLGAPDLLERASQGSSVEQSIVEAVVGSLHDFGRWSFVGSFTSSESVGSVAVGSADASCAIPVKDNREASFCRVSSTPTDESSSFAVPRVTTVDRSSESSISLNCAGCCVVRFGVLSNHK